MTSGIEDKNKGKFVEVITLSLTRGYTFTVTIAGVNCNALIDAVATKSCTSETFYNQLMIPQFLKAFCLLVTSASGSNLYPVGIAQGPFKLGGHSLSSVLLSVKNMIGLSYWVCILCKSIKSG